MTLPDTMGPTASCVWRGKALFGTRDGYVMEFDDAKKDDDGTAIDCRFGYSIIDDQTLERDTILHKIVIVPSEGSDDITYKVYRGNTPQEAYERNSNDLLLTGTVPRAGKPIVTGCRAPALFLELSNNAAAEAIQVERVEVVTSRGRMLTNRTYQAVGSSSLSGCVPGEGTTPGDPSGKGPGAGTGGGTREGISIDWIPPNPPEPPGPYPPGPGPPVKRRKNPVHKVIVEPDGMYDHGGNLAAVISPATEGA